MSEDSSSKPSPRSWLDKVSHLLHRDPQDRDELIELLTHAADRKLIDPQALEMIKGVLEVSDMQVRDIMVPRSQMVTVDIEDTPSDYIPAIKESGHSRFPVIGENKDTVMGILLAKDLINYDGSSLENLNLHALLRPILFIPESKRLDALLRDFRQSRNHMAIVIDEYGGVAGLVTIEDILEEIVGDISDEHDVEEDDYIKPLANNKYIVQALAPIEEFNDFFSCQLSDEEFDTIGGLITHEFGYLPKNGEEINIPGFKVKILSSDKRRLRVLEITKLVE